ncbi:hypothetical protein QFZ99_000149 [Paraburkholderia atlantica]
MRERIEEHIPFAGDERVDQQAACARIDHPVEYRIDASRPRHPMQLRVEQQQAHQSEPEHRDRTADEADEARDVIDPAVVAHGGDHAQRHADQHADDGRQGREFERCRKHPLDVLDHRMRGQQRHTEIAMQHIAHVDQELHCERRVEPELKTRRRVGCG